MGLFSRQRKPTPLNPLRDELARDLRALTARCVGEHPDRDDYRGILTRVDELLEGQRPRLLAFATLDLDAPVVDLPRLHEALGVLSAVQHLPRMVYALGEVLEQEKRDRALKPLQERARELLIRLEDLGHTWLLRQEELLGELGPD